MYLLTIKDGLGTRHIGPYASPKHASDDLDRVLETCSERARWQIHALETCLLYTSPSPRDLSTSRMPSSA